MATTTYETVTTSVDPDGIAVLTLNRPEALNAMNVPMIRDFSAALWDLDGREDVRVIVLTGAGQAFCAGADMAQDMFGKEAMDDVAALPRPAPLWELSTPLIAAVNGSAVGLGISLAMLCDIRLVADEAKMAFLFGRRGMVPDGGSSWLLQRQIGLSRAMELMLTGRFFRGPEAVEMGFAIQSVPAADILSAAIELAGEIARNVAPMSAAVIKHLNYRAAAEPDRAAASELEGEVIRWAGRSVDAKEGVLAFFERRPPEWTLSKHIDFPGRLASEPV